MTQGERVREIRKSLNLTLEKFGEKLGVQKSAISKIEKDNVKLSDQMAKSICREYNVNYEYLVHGEGEMFSVLPKTVLDELCRQYELDDFDRSLIEMYIQFPKPLRDYLKNNFLDILKKHRGNESHEETD